MYLHWSPVTKLLLLRAQDVLQMRWQLAVKHWLHSMHGCAAAASARSSSSDGIIISSASIMGAALLLLKLCDVARRCLLLLPMLLPARCPWTPAHCALQQGC
jgi:hypothetical protein